MKLVVMLLLVVGVRGEEKNVTMSGSDGECEMLLHQRGMFNPKMFFKMFSKICVNVRFPKELYKQCNQCMKEEAKKSSLIDDMLKGIFPEKKELAKFLESVDVCKLRVGGINNLEKDLTIDKLLKALMFDKWRGNQQAKEQLKQEITACFNNAQGNGYQKIVNMQKCLTTYLLSECSKNDEEPGMMLVIISKLLTIGDESKCTSVKIPQDIKKLRDRCLEEAKTSMNKMPESSDKSTNKSGSMQFVKSMKFVKQFMKQYMMKAVECFLGEKGMFDAEQKTIKVNGITKFVEQFEGWNSIQKEKGIVLESIRQCGKVFEEDSDFDDDDEDEDSDMMNKDENENDSKTTEERKIKELMKSKMEFEKCFIPKFANVCGINNELSDFFYPVLDPDFMGQLFKAFMEIGGEDAEELIAMLKEKLKT